MRLPPPRTLAIASAATLVLGLVLAAGWFWYAARQHEAMAAYATAIAAAQPALGAQATPEAQASAVRALETVLARHPSAEGAGLAALALGNLRYAQGDYERARAAWEIAASKAAGTRTILILARASIGSAWEATGQYDSALDAYRKALEELGPKDFLYEQLLVDRARMEESAGRKADAIATYRRLLKDVPQARRADEVRARLLALGAS